jgi:hypothetical protein
MDSQDRVTCVDEIPLLEGAKLVRSCVSATRRKSPYLT